MSKLPWFKFYPCDWLNDLGVKSLDFDAKGLWIDLLCIMDRCHPRGYLIAPNGKPFSTVELCRILGEPCEEKMKKFLKILEDSAIFSVDSNGIIFSRRMVEDEKDRNKSRLLGKKGGFHKHKKIIPPPIGVPIGVPIGNPIGSRSRDALLTSDSDSNSFSFSFFGIAKGDFSFPDWMLKEEFKNCWSAWVRQRKEKKKTLTPSTRTAQLKKMMKIGETRSIAMIKYTILQGFEGLYEEKGRSNQAANEGFTPKEKRKQATKRLLNTNRNQK